MDVWDDQEFFFSTIFHGIKSKWFQTSIYPHVKRTKIRQALALNHLVPCYTVHRGRLETIAF